MCGERSRRMKSQCSRKSRGPANGQRTLQDWPPLLHTLPGLFCFLLLNRAMDTSPPLSGSLLFPASTSRFFDRTSCPYYLLFRSCESPLRPSLEVASPSVRLVEFCVSISSIVQVFRKIGDPSPRTRGFSHSLVRTDGRP